MGGFRSIVARFPDLELDIRRRCAGDAHFRSICSDYEEAAAAFRHWRTVAPAGDRRAEDYRTILAELETEILDRLGNRGAAHGGHDAIDRASKRGR